MRRRADDAGGPGHGGAHRLAQQRDPRRDQGTPAGAEDLQIDLLVAGIDHRHHRRGVVRGDMRGGEGGKRGEADGGLRRGERDAACRRNADPQAGEAARAGGDGDAVKLPELDVGLIHHPREEWHDGLRMAARHGAALARDDRGAIGIEHGGRAGLERGVDGKDAHGLTFAAVDRDLGDGSTPTLGFRCRYLLG